MKIIVTGATGFLGQEIVKSVNNNCISFGFNNVCKNNGYQVDLIDRKKTFDILDRLNPDAIVHTAALTDVNKCQNNPYYAYQLNVKATKNIIEWAQSRKSGLRFIYISTDQVYNNNGASSEKHDVLPMNVYGMTKLWGEEKALLLKNSIVLRVNFVGFGGGLLDWVIRMNYQKNKVVLFDDIVFNPIYMPDLVDIIVGVIGGKHHGIFNIGSSGSCMTKAEYIIKIINKLHLKSIKTVFGKMSESEFITAPRPLDMCMSINKAQENLGVKLLSLEESIDQISVDYKYKQDI